MKNNQEFNMDSTCPYMDRYCRPGTVRYYRKTLWVIYATESTTPVSTGYNRGQKTTKGYEGPITDNNI